MEVLPKVCKRCKINKKKGKKILNDFFREIGEEISDGSGLNIPHVGTFQVVNNKKENNLNIFIDSGLMDRSGMVFKTSKSMKEKFNNKSREGVKYRIE